MSEQTFTSLDNLGETSTANSAIILKGKGQVVVELDPDHPGFRDEEYRKRRNRIAQLALDFAEMEPGSKIPEAEYTEEEHAVWKIINENIEPTHQKFACKEHLEYKKKIALSTDRIPQLQEVSDKVFAMSGFSLQPVGGLVQAEIFLRALGAGVFLSTQYIRHHSTPLYTPEPDVVHELVGHVAMLANPRFAELSRLVGEAAGRIKTEKDLEDLGRIYWYTIEFGVLREGDEVKAYGAGLLSSFGELESISKAELRPFDLQMMMDTPYDVTQYQPILFCADSFDHMYETLKDFLPKWNA